MIQDINNAKEIVSTWLGKSFNELSDLRKIVLIDMGYNLGSRINGFKKLKTALEQKDYIEAGAEI